MHQTTVRFGRDLWLVLEQEAERLGVSAAQYVREATLARLAYAAGRGDEASASREAFAWAGQARLSERAQAEMDAADRGGHARLSESVQAQLESAAALHAQGRLAHRRAEQLRAEAEALREQLANRR
jgi:hypothetical protein